jgi:hypothetical protein
MATSGTMTVGLAQFSMFIFLTNKRMEKGMCQIHQIRKIVKSGPLSSLLLAKLNNL